MKLFTVKFPDKMCHLCEDNIVVECKESNMVAFPVFSLFSDWMEKNQELLDLSVWDLEQGDVGPN
jgi:hypothetical protein